MDNPTLSQINSNVEQVYRYWGDHPGLYAMQDYFTFLGRPKMVRSSAVQALGNIRGKCVLEIGCGTGRNFLYLVDAVGPEGTIVGMDYSPAMLAAAEALCRRNDWTQITLMQGDAADLSSKSRYDAILSVLAMSAIPRWQTAMCKAWHALDIEGRISICDATLFHGIGRIFNPLIRPLYRKFAAWEPGRGIANEMQNLFGFIEIETFNFGTFYVVSSTKTADESCGKDCE